MVTCIVFPSISVDRRLLIDVNIDAKQYKDDETR